MKTLLVAALAITSLTQSVRSAEACGSYRPEPEVFRLSTHFIVGMNEFSRRRSFVLLPHERAPEKLDWQMLSPMSYDATQIAKDMSFANPVTLTLVGPSGTKVVKATKHVFLSRSWDFDAPTGALEVAGSEGFAIALEGNQSGTKWIELETVGSTNELRAWVAKQGVEAYDSSSIYVSRIPGTDYEAVSVFPKTGSKMITLVKMGDYNYGKFTGSPTGAFTLHGEQRLVVVDGARVTSVAL